MQLKATFPQQLKLRGATKEVKPVCVPARTTLRARHDVIVPRVASPATPPPATPATPSTVAAAAAVTAPIAPKKEKVRAPVDVDELQILQNTLTRTKEAQIKYSTYSQEQVDEIFRAAAFAANQMRIPLAKMAVKETGMGVVEDKVIKNHFASEFVYNRYKDMKTCGVIEEDKNGGIMKIAEPMGVVAGIVPTTNPTSTAIFKALLALKTRNGLVISPHPRAAGCTIAAAKCVRDAAVAAGAPPDIISWIEKPSMAASNALMTAPEVSLILATGGPAMVKAAYSSGHPSVGVGAGNTPAVICESADIKMAVSSILLSKTFDNGVICASEQSVVCCHKIYDQVKAEFKLRGAHFLSEEEKVKVRAGIMIDGRLNAAIVGQSVEKLAKIFDIKVPLGTKVLIGECETVGHEEPLSEEKLSPILGFFKSKDFEDGVAIADKLVNTFGPGHTAVLYVNPLNRKNIDYFGNMIKTVRILINSPAAQGAIGDVYNFHLDPSLTLGCGSWGSTSVSMNVGPSNMLNIKTVVERRENMLWFRVPPKIYFKPGCMEVALNELRGKKRAFIVTDKPLFEMGYADQVTRILDDVNVSHQIFYHVAPDPTLTCIREGLREIEEFRPDVIIALGGGSPMDAAKVMWLMYEVPETKFEGLSMRFMDIRKRVYKVPELGKKAIMVAIPTTSGTGSEVTPFSVVTDEVTGAKYPLADYALTPTMAIVDPLLTLNMPKKLTAYGGIDALTHALESYVSIFATEYTKGLAKEAIVLLFKYLPRAYNEGPNDLEAREKVHYAATIAGMSFANGFLGVCHSMAHKLGAKFHIPHGLANAALIQHVIRFNATDAPFKMAAFPQYKYPQAKAQYAELADLLGLGGKSNAQKSMLLIEAIEDLKAAVDIPPTLRDIITPEREEEYFAALEELAEEAFDDQCTGANPRYPRISELEQMYIDAWNTPISPVRSLDYINDGPP
eukprot:gene15525-21614_t